MTDDVDLDEQEEIDENDDGFETSDFMQVMEHVNKLRGVFGDVNLGPPIIRSELSQLHELAVSVIDNNEIDKSGDMLELAANIVSDVDDVMESMEYIQEVLSKLTELVDDELDE